MHTPHPHNMHTPHPHNMHTPQVRNPHFLGAPRRLCSAAFPRSRRPALTPPAGARRFGLALLSAAAISLTFAAVPALAAEQPLVVAGSTTTSNLTATCATLEANISPREAPTTYRFEYLTERQFEEDGHEFGAGTEATAEEPLGSDDALHLASVEVCGLARHSAYRFRALATNSQSPAGGTLGETASFSTLYGPSHELTATFGAGPPTATDPYPLSDPADVAVDQSTGDVYVTDTGTSERQTITDTATGGTFTLSFAGQTTEPIAFNAPAEGHSSVTSPSSGSVGSQLEALSTIGPGNVIVKPPPGSGPGVYEVIFGAQLGSTDVEQISVDPSALTGGTAIAATAVQGISGGAVEKFNEKGEFLLILGGAVNKKKVEEGKPPAEQDVCTKSEECQPPALGSQPGRFITPTYLAVDNSPGGNGALYVGDTSAGETVECPVNGQSFGALCQYNIVQKFDSSGHIISSWGVDGQKNGSDITGNVDRGFRQLSGLAVGPEGHLFVGTPGTTSNTIEEYSQSGTYLPPFIGLTSGSGVKVSTAGVYGVVGNRSEGPGAAGSIAVGVEKARFKRQVTPSGILTTGFAFDPSEEDLYQDSGSVVYHYPPDCNPELGPCEPFDSFGYHQLSGAEGVSVDGASHLLYVANSADDDIIVFADVRPQATTGPATEVGETSLTLTGNVDPAGHGPIEECFFEYGFSKAYGHTASCEQATPYAGATAVSTKVEGLTPLTDLPVGTEYHYRLVASNEKGATKAGTDHTATTTAPPRIEGVSSSRVAATSAELDATVNPDGLPTTYRFQYGTTTAYGETTPEAEITGSEGELFEVHKVKITIENLQPGAAYHFRLIAHNALGEATSEDQTFEFFPPNCPNQAVRQQTGAAYLPDCRAYELVSPANANGTIFFPSGPNTGQATAPSRFSFVGDYSSLPGANTINTGGDLYVATRTDTGWVSHYIGLPGSEAGCMGGPPSDPSSYSTVNNPTELNLTVLADPSMSHILNWNDGEPIYCVVGSNGTSGADPEVDFPSNAPYLWNADGTLAQRLPTDLEAKAGALEALNCPYPENRDEGICTGAVAASGDLTHFIFSSRSFEFAPGGLTTAPGSAYDDDLATGEVRLISTLKGSGEPIPQDPTFATTPAQREVSGGAEEFLRFPAVSADGSHVLISTATTGTAECGKDSGGIPVCPSARFLTSPVHLYMSIDDGGAVEVSYDELTHEDVAVSYVGMTEDGSKVFFTSEAHLTAEDPDHGGASLYMWSQQGEEEGKPLTLISKADPGSPADAGDTASCAPALAKVVEEGQQKEVPWTTKCGVVPYSSYPYSVASGGSGGNGISDTGIASGNGDIYFYSPEQLDGDHGVPGQQNLYDYRQGQVQFVTTLSPERSCIVTGFSKSLNPLDFTLCSAGPVVRIDVSPDDSHMAFTTPSRLTSYDNQGHLEMYSYTPSSGALVCDSCNPDGKPATADVQASEDGLFMTDDGRAFFSTTESLVPQDTNEATDVYEFVDGRPQLITPGTGTATVSTSNGVTSVDEIPGLIGVSANGTDVYFSTFDGIVSEDHNGDFLRFYDARTDGGFPQPPPVQPCAAAEECHGPGTEAPELPTQATAAGLTGGNVIPEKSAAGKHKKAKDKHHKRDKNKAHKRKSKRRHARAIHHGRGGNK
jgi:NHL repeat